MKPRVAVLHHPRSFFPLELSRQVGDDVELLWVLDEEAAAERNSVRLLRHLGEVVEIGELDLDAAADTLGRARPDAIVSFVDDHLEIAAALALRLGLRYHSPSIAEVLSDKRLQRVTLDSAGVPGPRFWNVSNSPDAAELEAIAAKISFPAVLKPARGSGSKGIVQLDRVEDFTGHVLEGSQGGWIVEELLEDDPDQDQRFASYLSVESVVSAGAITNVAVTGRFQLAAPFRETGNFIPGILRSELVGPVHEMVNRAIVALGITDAVVHSEVKLTPSGSKNGQVNGRLGGRPPFVLQSVSELNLFRVAIDVALGRPLDLQAPLQTGGVGFWLMVQPPTCARSVTSVQGVEELAGLPGVDRVDLRRHPGDLVDWRVGTDSAVLTVRGRVESHDDLAETIEFVHNKLLVTYDE